MDEIIDRELLEVLACPKCKGDVELKGSFLLCRKDGLAFPILEGVPDMLIEDAWDIVKAEKGKFSHGLKL